MQPRAAEVGAAPPAPPSARRERGHPYSTDSAVHNISGADGRNHDRDQKKTSRENIIMQAEPRCNT